MVCQHECSNITQDKLGTQDTGHGTRDTGHPPKGGDPRRELIDELLRIVRSLLGELSEAQRLRLRMPLRDNLEYTSRERERAMEKLALLAGEPRGRA
jgi:hypothetical protein